MKGHEARELPDFDWETHKFRVFAGLPCPVPASRRDDPMRKTLVAVFFACLDCSTGLRTPNDF